MIPGSLRSFGIGDPSDFNPARAVELQTQESIEATREVDTPKTRVEFESLTLIEDEDAGSTNMAIYATLKDASANTIGSFRWNNRGVQVDEVRGFPLTSDFDNPAKQSQRSISRGCGKGDAITWTPKKSHLAASIRSRKYSAS